MLVTDAIDIYDFKGLVTIQELSDLATDKNAAPASPAWDSSTKTACQDAVNACAKAAWSDIWYGGGAIPIGLSSVATEPTTASKTPGPTNIPGGLYNDLLVITKYHLRQRYFLSQEFPGQRDHPWVVEYMNTCKSIDAIRRGKPAGLGITFNAGSSAYKSGSDPRIYKAPNTGGTSDFQDQ